METAGEVANNHGDMLALSERHGVALETCRNANQWARDWRELIIDLDTADLSRDFMLAARNAAADGLSTSLQRDGNDRPTFRTEYVATELFYGKMGARSDEFRQTIEGPGLQPVPNFSRLDEVLDVLLKQREAGNFPYNLDAAQLPQDERNMPSSLPRGGAEHANFLFATCYYMRGGIKSYVAFRALSKVYEADPELFNPFDAQGRDPAIIADTLQQHGLGFSKDVISEQWVKNAERMSAQFNGDPRKLFEGTTEYTELLKRIQNKSGRGFSGFQEKMTSMLAYYLMSDELIPYFDFPLPVDFHVLRVSAATGMIDFKNLPEDGNIYHDKTLAMLRNMYHDYSVTHGISQLQVCDAVWSLSSAICGTQPGNIMLEPNRADGRDGRSTLIVPQTIDIDSHEQQTAYNRSCALCPIEEQCGLNFPSKAYYVQGKMVSSPRVRFPQNTLFGAETLFPPEK